MSKPGVVAGLLLVGLVVATLFVVLSSASLPPLVAAHFTADGSADGLMPRAVTGR